ncbi:substrate-binding periplasmic protein [Chitinimonas lacunae]|uniref:Substrate-binding periplasmic protein n=1 Tax=Chitinimonas lacunae TaxID=1963018 RepID=A0ABV8MVC3_9NEIS
MPDRLVFALRPLPPYMMVEGGRFTGSHVEIIGRLATALGVRLEIVECPLARCLKLLEDGSADVSMGLVASPEREVYAAFLLPPYAHAVPTYFFQRTNDLREVREYNDLRNLRIGVVNGLRYFDEFDKDQTLQKDFAPNTETNFRKLLAGRLDVVPAGANVGTRFESDPEFAGKLKRASYVRQNSTLRQISLSRRSPWFGHRALMERKLAQLVDSGEIANILKYYETAYLSACRKSQRC